jgi:hypothetical protein
MKKATRVLIDLRKPYCVKEPSVVSVKLVGGGIPNNCSENALNVTENGNNTVHSVTGWLVHPYNAARKTTQIVQHWWNKEVDGGHFDTTPSHVDGCEYVMDLDLLKFVINNFDDINSNVATSILLHDSGLIEGYESDPTVPFFGAKKVQLKSLSTKHLYGLN